MMFDHCWTEFSESSLLELESRPLVRGGCTEQVSQHCLRSCLTKILRSSKSSLTRDLLVWDGDGVLGECLVVADWCAWRLSCAVFRSGEIVWQEEAKNHVASTRDFCRGEVGKTNWWSS